MTTDRRPAEDLDAEATDHLAGHLADLANEMQSVAGELEEAADREDYRDVDNQFTELRSLMGELDDAHDHLPAVPEVA